MRVGDALMRKLSAQHFRALSYRLSSQYRICVAKYNLPKGAVSEDGDFK